MSDELRTIKRTLSRDGIDYEFTVTVTGNKSAMYQIVHVPGMGSKEDRQRYLGTGDGIENMSKTAEDIANKIIEAHLAKGKKA